MKIIGIDVGAQGGIAINDRGVTSVMKIPKNVNEINILFKILKTEKTIIFMEKVFFMKSDMQGGKAFGIRKMLKQYDQLKTVITLLEIPLIEVYAVTWQAGLKLRKKKEDKRDRKNRYKEVAAHYYPDVKVTLWNADALLILHFGRLKLKTDPQWVLTESQKQGQNVDDLLKVV